MTDDVIKSNPCVSNPCIGKPIINKYVIAEEMERCGRADIALIILYDDESVWGDGVGNNINDVDVDAKGNPTEKGYQSIIKVMEKNREQMNRSTWNERFDLAIKDYKYFADCMLENEHGGGKRDADEIEEEYLIDLGSPDKDAQESWTVFLWYPRYQNGKDEPRTMFLNRVMLRNTERRCQHEYDCCGGIYCNCMTIEYYDWLREGWMLSQNFYRNI